MFNRTRSGVPRCVLGTHMTDANIPEAEQQQIRAAFTSRATAGEVADARTLITAYAPKRSTRSRAWPSGLRRIHDNLGFHMEELLANNKRSAEKWAQCDRCGTWRRLPPYVDVDRLPERWFCDMNVWDAARARCVAPEPGATTPEAAYSVSEVPASAANAEAAAASAPAEEEEDDTGPSPAPSPPRRRGTAKRRRSDAKPAVPALVVRGQGGEVRNHGTLAGLIAAGLIVPGPIVVEWHRSLPDYRRSEGTLLEDGRLRYKGKTYDSPAAFTRATGVMGKHNAYHVLYTPDGTPIQSFRGGREKAQVPRPRAMPKRARAPKASSAGNPPAPPPPPCPICLEDLDASPALACGHRIHEACMRQLAATAWADGAKRTRARGTAVPCPLCREQSYVQ